MLAAIKKRQAIRDYRDKLGPHLRKRHGKRDRYSTEQVRHGAYELGLPLDPLCYAYVMYCSPEDFRAHHEAVGESCDYDAMNAEVADVFSRPAITDSTAGWLDAGGGDSGGDAGDGGAGDCGSSD